MADHTEPLADRIVDLGTELNRHIDWLADRLVKNEQACHGHQARDERALKWETLGRIAAYREVLTMIFGLGWSEIYQRSAAVRSKAAS